MRRTAGAEASSLDDIESGRHSASGAPGWDAGSTALGLERLMDDRRRTGKDLLRRVKVRAYLKWHGICLDSPIWGSDTTCDGLLAEKTAGGSAWRGWQLLSVAARVDVHDGSSAER
jgi:hypothetical protein